MCLCSSAGPVETPQRHRLGAPLDADFAERLQDKLTRESLGCRLSNNDRTWLGDTLDPCRHVRGVTECHGVAFGGSDEAGRDFSTVDADTDVEVGDVPGRLDVAGVLLRHMEDVQGRPRCALGVVLVRQRDAEERRDPVAHERIDDTSELFDRGGHAGHAFADQRSDLLRRQTLADGGRADDVGEEDCGWTEFFGTRSFLAGPTPRRTRRGFQLGRR